MKVIKPIVIDDASGVLTSSTMAEPSGPDPAVWNVGTPYVAGDFAYVASTHRVYKCIANNTGVDPVANSALPTPTAWTDYGPTNKWAMFDNRVNTASVQATGPMTIVLEPGIVNSLALLDLVGDEVEVSMLDEPAGSSVYSRTISLEQSMVADWYAYFFEPFSQRASVVLTDLPPYLDCEVTVTLTGSADLACGGLILGSVYPIGGTKFGASAGLMDYSRKDVNAETGVVTLEQRSYRRLMRAHIQIPAGAVNAAHALLAQLRATPCVWIGDDSGAYDPLTVFGWYRSLSLSVAYVTTSFYELEIEGMV